MKDMMKEAHEEAREAAVPGARGKEYSDKERMGDEGQPYRRGGGIHGHHAGHHGKGPKHHSIHHRERGGFMPEEVEHSEEKRTEKASHEHEAKGSHDGEAHEEYPDEKKRGGKVHHKRHKRAKGGVLPLDGAKEHKTHSMNHHHARKRGGHVKGEHEAHRPDRRARGGSVTADLRPETAAGRVSVPDYQKQHELPRHGLGKSKDNRGPKALQGSHRP